MNKRRDFIQLSATLLGLPLVSLPELASFGDLRASGPMVKQPEECDTVLVRANTPITFHLSKMTDGVTSISLLSEELIPGSAIPEHKHLYEDEYFFFVSGTGQVMIDGKEFPFQPGTTAFIPRNTWHAIKNTGSEKAVFSFGYSPAGFEEFFRQIGTPRGQEFRQKPATEFAAIAKKFGMVFR